MRRSDGTCRGSRNAVRDVAGKVDKGGRKDTMFPAWSNGMQYRIPRLEALLAPTVPELP